MTFLYYTIFSVYNQNLELLMGAYEVMLNSVTLEQYAEIESSYLNRISDTSQIRWHAFYH